MKRTAFAWCCENPIHRGCCFLKPLIREMAQRYVESWRDEDPHFGDPVWEDGLAVCVCVWGESLREDDAGEIHCCCIPNHQWVTGQKRTPVSIDGVSTLPLAVEYGAFLTSDTWSCWATYGETWHMPLRVVESYHLLKWQSPTATIAGKAAAARDYCWTGASCFTDWSVASWEMIAQQL